MVCPSPDSSPTARNKTSLPAPSLSTPFLCLPLCPPPHWGSSWVHGTTQIPPQEMCPWQMQGLSQAHWCPHTGAHLRQPGAGAGQQRAAELLLGADSCRERGRREHGCHHVNARDPRVHLFRVPVKKGQNTDGLSLSKTEGSALQTRSESPQAWPQPARTSGTLPTANLSTAG